MPKFPENKSPFMMSGMTFKEGQSPMKSKSWDKFKAKVKSGVGKVKSKIDTWKKENPKTAKLIKNVGEGLGESFSGMSTTTEPIVMESAPRPSTQSTEVPDVTRLIVSKDIKLKPPPEGPKGPIVKRSPTRNYKKGYYKT